MYARARTPMITTTSSSTTTLETITDSNPTPTSSATSTFLAPASASTPPKSETTPTGGTGETSSAAGQLMSAENRTPPLVVAAVEDKDEDENSDIVETASEEDTSPLQSETSSTAKGIGNEVAPQDNKNAKTTLTAQPDPEKAKETNVVQKSPDDTSSDKPKRTSTVRHHRKHHKHHHRRTQGKRERRNKTLMPGENPALSNKRNLMPGENPTVPDKSTLNTPAPIIREKRLETMPIAEPKAQTLSSPSDLDPVHRALYLRNKILSQMKHMIQMEEKRNAIEKHSEEPPSTPKSDPTTTQPPVFSEANFQTTQAQYLAANKKRDAEADGQMGKNQNQEQPREEKTVKRDAQDAHGEKLQKETRKAETSGQMNNNQEQPQEETKKAQAGGQLNNNQEQPQAETKKAQASGQINNQEQPQKERRQTQAGGQINNNQEQPQKERRQAQAGGQNNGNQEQLQKEKRKAEAGDRMRNNHEQLQEETKRAQTDGQISNGNQEKLQEETKKAEAGSQNKGNQEQVREETRKGQTDGQMNNNQERLQEQGEKREVGGQINNQEQPRDQRSTKKDTQPKGQIKNNNQEQPQEEKEEAKTGGEMNNNQDQLQEQGGKAQTGEHINNNQEQLQEEKQKAEAGGQMSNNNQEQFQEQGGKAQADEQINKNGNQEQLQEEKISKRDAQAVGQINNANQEQQPQEEMSRKRDTQADSQMNINGNQEQLQEDKISKRDVKVDSQMNNNGNQEQPREDRISKRNVQADGQINTNGNQEHLEGERNVKRDVQINDQINNNQKQLQKERKEAEAIGQMSNNNQEQLQEEKRKAETAGQITNNQEQLQAGGQVNNVGNQEQQLQEEMIRKRDAQADGQMNNNDNQEQLQDEMIRKRDAQAVSQINNNGNQEQPREDRIKKRDVQADGQINNNGNQEQPREDRIKKRDVQADGQINNNCNHEPLQDEMIRKRDAQADGQINNNGNQEQPREEKGSDMPAFCLGSEGENNGQTDESNPQNIPFAVMEKMRFMERMRDDLRKQNLIPEDHTYDQPLMPDDENMEYGGRETRMVPRRKHFWPSPQQRMIRRRNTRPPLVVVDNVRPREREMAVVLPTASFDIVREVPSNLPEVTVNKLTAPNNDQATFEIAQEVPSNLQEMAVNKLTAPSNNQDADSQYNTLGSILEAQKIDEQGIITPLKVVTEAPVQPGSPEEFAFKMDINQFYKRFMKKSENAETDQPTTEYSGSEGEKPKDVGQVILDGYAQIQEKPETKREAREGVQRFIRALVRRCTYHGDQCFDNQCPGRLTSMLVAAAKLNEEKMRQDAENEDMTTSATTVATVLAQAVHEADKEHGGQADDKRREMTKQFLISRIMEMLMDEFSAAKADQASKDKQPGSDQSQIGHLNFDPDSPAVQEAVALAAFRQHPAFNREMFFRKMLFAVRRPPMDPTQEDKKDDKPVKVEPPKSDEDDDIFGGGVEVITQETTPSDSNSFVHINIQTFGDNLQSTPKTEIEEAYEPIFDEMPSQGVLKNAEVEKEQSGYPDVHDGESDLVCIADDNDMDKAENCASDQPQSRVLEIVITPKNPEGDSSSEMTTEGKKEEITPSTPEPSSPLTEQSTSDATIFTTSQNQIITDEATENEMSDQQFFQQDNQETMPQFVLVANVQEADDPNVAKIRQTLENLMKSADDGKAEVEVNKNVNADVLKKAPGKDDVELAKDVNLDLVKDGKRAPGKVESEVAKDVNSDVVKTSKKASAKAELNVTNADVVKTSKKAKAVPEDEDFAEQLKLQSRPKRHFPTLSQQPPDFEEPSFLLQRDSDEDETHAPNDDEVLFLFQTSAPPDAPPENHFGSGFLSFLNSRPRFEDIFPFNHFPWATRSRDNVYDGMFATTPDSNLDKKQETVLFYRQDQRTKKILTSPNKIVAVVF
ncbi:trichohyalin-like [Ctenocephalides felis]|uniref:trichohyalin-like n=1 Tax=Ctenocephalides felis TaxID=7515 RepID=UPI000E6E1718|nr:trichohyalin-like [Ctenocephalides felis]